jgi:hypothetical protein
MHAHVRFHALARGALAVKRWLAGRALTPALADAFAREAPAMPHAENVHLWRDDLAAIARPPRGRILDLVYARLAEELGVDVMTARRSLRG